MGYTDIPNEWLVVIPYQSMFIVGCIFSIESMFKMLDVKTMICPFAGGWSLDIIGFFS